ncbi:pentapeptide repeat-containing protein [Amycolatopsis mongoliensis]|uniref:Pentapeptide repeat-containing protein n=1 Tax=Amycolatopsis mongoliensis TaxID=715475 RepID=A0A9Y2NF57_9PSEU|nr:pentapeptide repeat-containing protein [Amycolatopsis sp. 4-36]WIX99398.1 pentapeptide repeat-containing protein [Amycolatopsis sp. 4-36]
MSTLTPVPVLALIGAVSGAVTAWLILRRDRPVQVLTPSAPPEPMAPDVTARLLADERTARLAALAHLAELAGSDPARRQACVDEIVAQLRCRWPDRRAWQADLWRLLLPHLRRTSPRFWPGMALCLESLALHDVDLRGCEVRDLVFRGVRFLGDARFEGVVVTGLACFEEAWFARHARFGGARFGTGADFEHVTFTGNAAFAEVDARDTMWFDEARFSALADFTAAGFTAVSFAGVGFAGRTTFRDARFADAFFEGARFSGPADFAGTSAERFRFPRARARTDAHVVRTWPSGWGLGPPRPLKPGVWAELRESRTR